MTAGSMTLLEEGGKDGNIYIPSTLGPIDHRRFHTIYTCIVHTQTQEGPYRVPRNKNKKANKDQMVALVALFV